MQRPKRKYWYKGKILHTSDVLRLSGVDKDTYKMRVRRGWPLVMAMATPINGSGGLSDLIYEIEPIVQGEFHKRAIVILPVDDSRIKAYEGMLRSGGGGINVRWLGKKGFQRFVSDMGDRPVNTIFMRRNPSEPFGPDNCYWGKEKR